MTKVDKFGEFRSAVGLKADKTERYHQRQQQHPDEVLVTAEKAKRRRQQFTQFPHSWVEGLRNARRTGSYRLALFLLHRHWKEGGKPVRVSNLAVEWVGLSPQEKMRALRELESLGLVRVDRQPNRAPTVTVIIPPG